MELTFSSKETWQVMNASESNAAGKEIWVPGQRMLQFYAGRPGKASCRVMLEPRPEEGADLSSGLS